MLKKVSQSRSVGNIGLSSKLLPKLTNILAKFSISDKNLSPKITGSITPKSLLPNKTSPPLPTETEKPSSASMLTVSWAFKFIESLEDNKILSSYELNNNLPEFKIICESEYKFGDLGSSPVSYDLYFLEATSMGIC